LTGGSKCLLEKVGGSKKLKTEGNIFSVANFLETHGTECDNSAYNSPFFLLASLADYIWLPTFKAVFKGEDGLAGSTPSHNF